MYLDFQNEEQLKNKQQILMDANQNMDTTEIPREIISGLNTGGSNLGSNIEESSVPISTADNGIDGQNPQVSSHFSQLDVKDKYRLHYASNFDIPPYYVDWSPVILFERKTKFILISIVKKRNFFVFREGEEDSEDVVLMFGCQELFQEDEHFFHQEAIQGEEDSQGNNKISLGNNNISLGNNNIKYKHWFLVLPKNLFNLKQQFYLSSNLFLHLK